MSSTVRGFSVRSVDMGHGRGDPGKLNVSVGKVLPATGTGSLFTVTGVINATMIGIVSTALSVTSVHTSIGVTGNNTLIAANQAAGLVSTAVGSVIALPSTLGAAMPVPVTATSAIASMADFVISNTAITITTDATNTGAITWVLSWVPLFPKLGAAVVTN